VTGSPAVPGEQGKVPASGAAQAEEETPQSELIRVRRGIEQIQAPLERNYNISVVEAGSSFMERRSCGASASPLRTLPFSNLRRVCRYHSLSCKVSVFALYP
jgi:hypothetical protein